MHKVMKQLLTNKAVCYLKNDFLFLHNQQDPKEFSNEFSKEFPDLQVFALIFSKYLRNMHHFFLSLQLSFRLFYIFKEKLVFNWLHFVVAKLFINDFIYHISAFILFNFLNQIYRKRIY
jgi:hypothetical protein